MEYESPSAAYSGTLQSILMKREEKQRQAMLDQHKIEMDRAENARAERELELRHQEMQERQQDRRQSQQDRQALNASQIEQRQQAKYDKTVAGMKPGDVMTPDMARASVSLGEQSDLMNPKQGLRDFMETLPQGSPARTGVAAQVGTPSTEQMVQTNTPLRFVGSPAQRDAAEKQTRIRGLMTKMGTQKPGSPEWLQTAAEVETSGGTLPAATLKLMEGPSPETFSDASYTLPGVGSIVGQRNKQGRILYQGKDVTDQVRPYVAPKDTSAADATRAASAATHFDTVHQQAVKELDDVIKPIRGQVDTVNSMDTALRQNSNVADAVLAPMVLKATVSGMGSGFRMTQPEINQVLKASRTSWESLQLALNSWTNSGGLNPDGSPNPKVPLILNDNQREAIRSLAKAIRSKATDQLHTATKARHAMDDATTPQELHRISTKLQEDLYPAEETAPSGDAYSAYLARTKGKK